MNGLLKSLFLTAAILIAGPVAAEPVDINTADAQALAANIKGVGAKKAEAIVEYRRKHGPFKRPEDLARVKGIGPKLVEQNRHIIRVGKPQR